MTHLQIFSWDNNNIFQARGLKVKTLFGLQLAYLGSGLDHPKRLVFISLLLLQYLQVMSKEWIIQ
jgi:hypothetical protein